MIDIKILVATLSTILICVNSSCLHNGCEMSQGLPAKDIDTRFTGLLRDGEYIDNVLKVVTWNINQPFQTGKWDSSDKSVCNFLKRMQPFVS